MDESAGPGEVDCCLEQATSASALMHRRTRLRFIRVTSLYFGNAAAAPLQCRVGLNEQSQEAFHRSGRRGADNAPPAALDQRGSYFLAAARFFFFAGSFGRDLPKEP